ncbi:DUF2946 family protein [Aquisalimonas lutea]|uniref:DUF2946 family protein n=1 Tax=Aquisalimonas lutea TaxID=1327750 RepID=UPI0025B32404|nr:DUF2946 family protein [Aquisalimonas lutea]MDN3518634.1 DUF2946 family protein [Aquisalimonas lutea]
MDPSVHNAMARWPDVPAVYGYIGVNRRGDFLLQGHRVTHERTLAFIQRNYDVDDHGRAFFQNGPQRAYADLEATPWIYHLGNDRALATHTGRPARELRQAWLTPDGDVVLVTELGPGLVHAQDLDRLGDALEDSGGGTGGVAGRLHLAAGDAPLESLASNNLTACFGFDAHPQPAPDDLRAAVSEWRPAWRLRADDG